MEDRKTRQEAGKQGRNSRSEETRWEEERDGLTGTRRSVLKAARGLKVAEKVRIRGRHARAGGRGLWRHIYCGKLSVSAPACVSACACAINSTSLFPSVFSARREREEVGHCSLSPRSSSLSPFLSSSLFPSPSVSSPLLVSLTPSLPPFYFAYSSCLARPYGKMQLKEKNAQAGTRERSAASWRS